MCNCIEELNKKLAELNTKLDLAFTASGPSMLIKTAKIDKEAPKGPTVLFVTFCPVCGERVRP